MNSTKLGPFLETVNDNEIYQPKYKNLGIYENADLDTGSNESGFHLHNREITQEHTSPGLK
jgi:hypothetical protein